MKSETELRDRVKELHENAEKEEKLLRDILKRNDQHPGFFKYYCKLYEYLCD